MYVELKIMAHTKEIARIRKDVMGNKNAFSARFNIIFLINMMGQFCLRI